MRPCHEANNRRVSLSKETKNKLRNEFGKYTETYTHRISLKSTLPYVATDSLNGKDNKLDFMNVISILSLVYGDSSEYGLKRQLMSSSCFTSNEALYGYEEDQENKKEQEEPITDNESEEESVMDFNTQKASLSPQNKRGKVLRNIDQLNLRSPVTKSRPKRNLGGTVNIDASLKSSTQKDSTSIAHSRPRRIGAVGTVITIQKITGCRFESDQTIPETLTESVNLVVKVSTMKWNCLLGNTMNTIGALGHLSLIVSAKKETVLTRALSSTRLTDTLKVNLPTVSYAFSLHGYSTAITRYGLNLDFSFLQQYANKNRLPMLVLLKIVYPCGSIKFHIIGIVLVTVNNEINMHLVEGCHPEKKTVPLNKASLIWCCGECKSYSVDQFVAFVPEKKAVKKLKKDSIKCNTTDRQKRMYYEDAEGRKTLSASIAPQLKKIESQ